MRRIRSRDLLDPTESFVLQTRGQLSPQPLRLIARLSPRFWATRTPGCAVVPRADSVMARTSSASILITSKRRARSVVVFSTQSLRRSSRGLSACAIARFVFHGGWNPARQRASRCCNTFSRFASPGVRLGRVQQFAGGKRSRHGHAAVDPDHAPVARPCDWVGDVDERHMPTASSITIDPVGLNPVRHRPRQAKPHPPNLGHPHATDAAVQPLDVTRLDADLPKSFIHIGFTPGWTAVCASEKIPHSLRKIPQSLLLYRLTSRTQPAVLSASVSQLCGLLYVARRLATWLPVPLLLDRQIPDIPRIAAVPQQRQLLLMSWQQPKPGHTRTVSRTPPTGTVRPPAPSGSVSP